MLRETPVPDCVDAAVESMQPSCRPGSPDCARRVAELLQLGGGDDPVLSRCQLGQATVCTHFFPHTGNKGVRA
jgi:hypothetical protein